MRTGTVAIFAVAGLLLNGCATLIHGSHQTIPITSDPPGAQLNIGGSQYITPADVSLARDQEYQAIVTKPGYETQTMEIHSSFSAATLVDLIFIIPWAVDLADGAAYSLEPETVELRLQPQLASAAARSDVAAAIAAPAVATAVPPGLPVNAGSPGNEWQPAQ
ncbi:MAG TPA: PEGA domain-containing protein [Candidatus Binataceae bacterium]|nr:PEGA domain-containing protein [Candidatus Binataceae bacterium]